MVLKKKDDDDERKVIAINFKLLSILLSKLRQKSKLSLINQLHLALAYSMFVLVNIVQAYCLSIATFLRHVAEEIAFCILQMSNNFDRIHYS